MVMVVIVAGVVGIVFFAYWYRRSVVAQPAPSASAVSGLSVVGSLYIVQRDIPVSIPALQVQATLVEHSKENESVQSVLEFTTDTKEAVQTIAFNQLRQTQMVNGHSVQLVQASVDAIQIVVK